MHLESITNILIGNYNIAFHFGSFISFPISQKEGFSQYHLPKKGEIIQYDIALFGTGRNGTPFKTQSNERNHSVSHHQKEEINQYPLIQLVSIH